MRSEIVVIGAGASGLMAAYHAARALVDAGSAAQVTVLEKMPRPARKVMITGKGRCNFTNVKDWNAFSGHIRSKANFVKSAFYNLPSQAVVDWFEGFGMPTVVERGDRAFPASHHASDVVDTLVNACLSLGVKLETEAEVASVERQPQGFDVKLVDGREWKCARLIVATGGLSYPTTGSTGDGLRWAVELGHKLVPTFPSLTALVPKGYKQTEDKDLHIDRSTPLAELGQQLCGIQLKNIQLSLLIEGTEADSEFGDIDFTDGGLEGPVGFQLSRKAVKALVNGSRVSLDLDLKPGVDLTELTVRVKQLWAEIEKDRADTKVWVNLVSIAKALKSWQFEIVGHVGYERAVVTAGGVSTDDFVAKTMESRVVPGLYLCGEVLDIDADTGGYNLQLAFSTGALAGLNAAKSL